MASAHANLGRLDDAQAALQDMYSREPDNSFGLKEARRQNADAPATRRYFDRRRRAGLPE